MDNVVDRYFPLVDALEVQLEEIEERIFADESARTNIRELYALKHKLMVMRHAVEPLIEVLHKLYGGRVPPICQGVQDYFRDVYDHLLRLSTQLDGLRDMVITAMSVNLSLINMGTTDITKSLAAYAALVAVPTLIAGIYGMNFEVHAGAQGVVGVSVRDRHDGGDRLLPLAEVQEGRLALINGVRLQLS